ncbi:hypothetical protein ACHAWF_017554 [Thalassiosira exigua]
MAPWSSPSPSDASVPADLVDSLSRPDPRTALLASARESEALASRLAEELAASLSGKAGGAADRHLPHHRPRGRKDKDGKDKDDGGGGSGGAGGGGGGGGGGRFPVPLPRSLRDAPRPAPPLPPSDDDGDEGNDGNGTGESDGDGTSKASRDLPPEPISRSLHRANPSHPLTHAALASESILSSLSKIASGGSAASSEMRALERQRRTVDAEARDLEHALAVREGTVRGSDSLMGRRYADAARAVADVDAILGGKGGGGPPATDRARELAGSESLDAHARSAEVLKRAVGERYEAAVRSGDVAGLSELTPLLGTLDMAGSGVRLYLEYSQGVLAKEMDADPAADEGPVDVRDVPREEGMSRAAMRRRAEEERRKRDLNSAPLKLARIYNAAVSHLRHHLPMVAYSLGEADGDAALVQLVHAEAERRAVDVLRGHAAERELGRTVRRAEAVANKIEDRFAGGGGGGAGGGGSKGSGDELDAGLFGAMGDGAVSELLVGLGDAVGGGGGPTTTTDVAARREAALRDDRGFAVEVGSLPDVDAALEEWALILQHTESYERFVRHAAAEVIKARKLRREQKREERRRRKEAEEAREKDDAAMGVEGMTSPRQRSAEAIDEGREEGEEEGEEEEKAEILPPHTALNEAAAEVGGYYASLERCLLLAGMQRAFVRAGFPDDTTFRPAAVGDSSSVPSKYGSHGGGGGLPPSGSGALQTTLVEEVLFASRRSALRAFATGHVGTASAFANVVADVLGRVLLEVLVRRAAAGTELVRPGEGGLLDGNPEGLGRAALSFANKAGKGLRGAARARAGGGGGDAAANPIEDPAEARRRALLGVARAVASLNDLEVAAEYASRLASNLSKEVDAGYPRGTHDTEQLRMCVRGLDAVVESLTRASDRATEGLVSTVMPRARAIANDAAGQEGGGGGATSAGAAAANFLGSPVLVAGGNAGGATKALDYDLDDAAFELAQLGEGYIDRMCSGLDELIEPLRVHLLPKLADSLVIGIMGGVAKRLEAAIRKSKFTPLGAISLDSDVRSLLNFAKDRLDDQSLRSNVTLCRACPPLSRLSQISSLMNVDDLEDALDLISASKRKGGWDLKLDDAKTLLSLRVDFEGSKVNDLLQIDEE